MVREIYEEISYFVPPGSFEYLTSYEAVDITQHGAIVHAEFFVARDLPVERIVITEGSLLILKPEELVSVEPELTPPTRFAIRAFLNTRPIGGARLRWL